MNLHAMYSTFKMGNGKSPPIIKTSKIGYDFLFTKINEKNSRYFLD